jgi:hypothetical protein
LRALSWYLSVSDRLLPPLITACELRGVGATTAFRVAPILGPDEFDATPAGLLPGPPKPPAAATPLGPPTARIAQLKITFVPIRSMVSLTKF